MVYFDNAATSGYKPKCVFDALEYDLKHSANSGRSGHKAAIDAAVRIEKARRFFQAKLGCEDGNAAFTKNCTEALNLAIFGYLTSGMTVVTTAVEHNSVLRPLTEATKHGVKVVTVEPETDGTISPEKLGEAAKGAELVAVSAVSNVTGAVNDVAEIGKEIAKTGARFLVDGAQGVPILDIDMAEMNVDMLALPGHKGLHGVQGTGFLAFRNVKLKPILHGGTGTSSLSLSQPEEIPEGLEAGTQFSGGIAATRAGAEWTYGNINAYRGRVKTLAAELIYGLKDIGAEVYSTNPSAGVVSFNLKNAQPATVADALNEAGFAVRSGLHCAPLMHRFLGTADRGGAVRASLGIDNTAKEIGLFLSVLEQLSKQTE